MFECTKCPRTFTSQIGLNTHFAKVHCKRPRLTAPEFQLEDENLMLDEPYTESDPLHQYTNDFVFLGGNQQNPDEIVNDPELIPEQYAPFYSKKELDVVHFHLSANTSRTKITEYFQLQKGNPEYKSTSMKQIAANIKKIPQLHPELSAGDWKVETFSNGIHLELYLKLKLNTNYVLDFKCGPIDSCWNGEYKLLRKDPIDIIKSLMACHQDQFSLDDRIGRDVYSDIRGGTVYRTARTEIRARLPDAKLVGIILGVDDTQLTAHSGNHQGRPLYMTTTNLPLQLRRLINSYAWRAIGLLPNPRIPKREALNASEEAWLMQAKCEFASLVLRKCMAPLLAFREGGFQVITSMIDLYPISFR